ncbi:energy transducer TonB [Altererythrobacter sp. Root672]|uniref:energy transducer TonB n=1 Tax=Altererythrobacter sp. Root672 TaxID=1736584 RepID=UPI0006F63175|nr:energy transducer TonB [Altererythrobacter sp. Root672]KRA83574.1 hypothetical protein ASD76_05955 [Altererythrobacter sp. Root672]
MGVEVIGSVLFLSSLMAAPEFSNAAKKQFFGTYPTWAVRDGKSAATLIDLIVETDGKVRSCSVVSFIGDERLAQQECNAAMRLRLTPAKGVDGTPMPGRFRTFVTRWLVGGDKQSSEVKVARRTPDLTLKVDTPSLQITEPLSLGLALEIDSEGAVKRCEGIPASNPVDSSVVEWTCGHASKLTGPVLADKTGAPVAYVMNLSVRLEPSTPS